MTSTASQSAVQQRSCADNQQADASPNTSSADTSISATDKLLRIDEVLRKIPVSRSSWYAGIKAGIYPAGIKLGARSVVWRQSVIDALAISLFGFVPA